MLMLSSLSVCWVLFESTPNLYNSLNYSEIFTLVCVRARARSLSFFLSFTCVSFSINFTIALWPSPLHETSWILFLTRYIEIGVACLGYVMHYITIESSNTMLIFLFHLFFSFFEHKEWYGWCSHVTYKFWCAVWKCRSNENKIERDKKEYTKWFREKKKDREGERERERGRPTRMSDKSCF